MEANYYNHQTPQLRALSDKQIEKLYQATLECLNRTGINVHNAEARDLLVSAGARADGIRVRIPPHIIQDAVAAVPRSFSLWSRDRKQRLQIVPDKVYFGPGPTCTYFIDPYTGERRRAQTGDAGTTARICDALPNIDYVMSLSLLNNVTPQLASVYEFAEMLANTTKPILGWGFTPDNVSDIYQMALAAAESEDVLRRYPFVGFFSTFLSPLVLQDPDTAAMLRAAELDIPNIFIGGGVMGTTAPITNAGGLVIYLAGALAGVAIVQLKKRGAPMCIGGVIQAMDLRTARPAYGSPEAALNGLAIGDISRYLGIPCMGTAGASEAKEVDAQAAAESMMTILLSALSGSTLIHDVGFLDCADIGSLEMLVLIDEMIGMTKRVMRGIAVSDETLMLDLIDEVGPGGEFMSKMETARMCRAEIWNPALCTRDSWSNWQNAGAPTIHQRTLTRLKKILDTYPAPALPEGAAGRIAAILQAAEAREQAKA